MIGAIASMATGKLGGQVLEAVQTHVADKRQAKLIAQQLANDVKMTHLKNQMQTRDKEMRGTLLQKNWRPLWMMTVLVLVSMYFISAIAMFTYAFFFGIAAGKTWPISPGTMGFYGTFAQIGAALVGLTGMSFTIYGIGRSVEKVKGVAGAAADPKAKSKPTPRSIPTLRKRASQSLAENPPRNRAAPTVRKSPQYRERLDEQQQSMPEPAATPEPAPIPAAPEPDSTPTTLPAGLSVPAEPPPAPIEERPMFEGAGTRIDPV